MLNRRHFTFAALSLASAIAYGPALAAEAPDAFVQKLSTEVMDTVKGDKAIQAGDVGRIRALVDAKVMPLVNFPRMTSSAVGPQWRGASEDQRKRLMDEFKILLVNTYSGALTQVKDQTVQLKPLRAQPTDAEVVVRTEIKGRGEPIQLDYRLEKAGETWKIYDVNVGGFWLVEAYKGQFQKDLSASGIDGLIARLSEKNKAATAAPKS